ncbi:methyltransferase domain-containing protein [Hymenobacter busanensis]|uniref:Methyltransferase domain-containing protein n=1 Tax=Hymenobacter busanensis TaxID=2607656 RepID=A0A7L4ZXZ3_9BACT|nr:SAM-dependent methyltransferase [Hymenobacter busanensis]KAA9325291.1 methyltransferase domain-containing protein [Hymenobacter busanensis]QHJ07716.1 methyltransferase domain-containing protein [Hymenobacter busanensis]
MNPNQPHTLGPGYFDDVYRANADPWHFETSPYEHAKYADTLAALPRPRYERAFEIGCSLGVLTAQLASRCGHLLAVDVSEAALMRARQRCAALPQVRVQRLQVPDAFPAGHFDLILLSEVGYYWDEPTLHRAANAMLAAMPAGAHLLLVHWTPEVHDYPLTGDEVHDYFLSLTGDAGPLRHLHGHRADTYRLDLLELR